jgi:hypothetical protein
MGYINVVNITWDQGVSQVETPFTFTVQFECLKKIENEGTFIFQITNYSKIRCRVEIHLCRRLP